MEEELLHDLVEAKLKGNALKHSLLSLERYFLFVEEMGGGWAIAIAEHEEDQRRVLRGHRLPHFQIAVDTTWLQGMEETFWATFILGITPSQWDNLSKRYDWDGIYCDHCRDLDAEGELERLRKAINVDGVFVRLFPTSVAEGIFMQELAEEIQEVINMEAASEAEKEDPKE